VAIFDHDNWLCFWCKRPVIFPPVMKLFVSELKSAGHAEPLAYYHAHWTRSGAPLLDELGGTVDHIIAFKDGGTDLDENLTTCCWKCNQLKSSMSLEEWDRRPKRNPVRGKHAADWDGLSTLFMILIDRNPKAASNSELV
jgi:5-methylcytosine-specific restriction endonuclease McrA